MKGGFQDGGGLAKAQLPGTVVENTSVPNKQFQCLIQPDETCGGRVPAKFKQRQYSIQVLMLTSTGRANSPAHRTPMLACKFATFRIEWLPIRRMPHC